MNVVQFSEKFVSIIHCPFCGVEVTNADKAPEINPCAHTLFVATSEGFEYTSNQLIQQCESQFIGNPEIVGPQAVMERLKLPFSLCFVINSMPPSMLDLYVGFGPNEADF